MRYETTVLSTNALSRLVEDYLASCGARGLTPRTVDQSYGWPLRNVLLPFAAEQGISEVSGLTRPILDRLSVKLLTEGGRRSRTLSRETIHTYLRNINHFLTWAARQEEEVKGKCQLPKLPRRDIAILEADEVQRLEDTALTERDKLIVRVLYATGVRVSELVGLTPDSLVRRDKGRYLLVRGKGDRDRLVPILPALAARITRFVERTRPRESASPAIFLSLARRPSGDYEALTVVGVQQMVRELARRAGITRRVHPHLFRHSFATSCLNKGMSPIHVAQILGHTSLVMLTRTYSHLAPNDLYWALLRAEERDS